MTIGAPVDADLATILDVVQAQDVSWWEQAEVDAEVDRRRRTRRRVD